ncbi:MAG: spore maturation protein [Firmicutes bacterium]|nr:spore maturation protein [Bacillota bacterium]HXL03992.1 nucleoside recognition domain-containing protein [Bacillota bacterium]
MINTIWLMLIVIGTLTGIATGTSADVTKAAIESANQAVNICLGFIGIMAMWNGLMKIADSAGLTKRLARIFAPVARLLFPSLPKDHPALAAITMSIAANLLGMGNAATPLGLKAMEELASLNEAQDMPSDAMCTFVAISTAGITLVPTTIIAIRAQYHSNNPAEVVMPIIIMNIIATFVAILADIFFRPISRGN